MPDPASQPPQDIRRCCRQRAAGRARRAGCCGARSSASASPTSWRRCGRCRHRRSRWPRSAWPARSRCSRCTKWRRALRERQRRPGQAHADRLIAFPLGHAVGQAMLSGGALRYRMYTPAGFSATEVGATVLLANMPYALGFGLLLDISLVFAADLLAPMFRVSSQWLFVLGVHRPVQRRRLRPADPAAEEAVKLGGWSVNLPTPAMTALQLVVGLADMFLVSSVLYLLLPESGRHRLPGVPGRVPRERAGRRAESRAGRTRRDRVDAAADAAGRAARAVAGGRADVPHDLRDRPGAAARSRCGSSSKASRGTARCCALIGRQAPIIRPDEPDHRQERMSQAAAAFERRFDARRDAPVAACAGTHFLVHDARQSQRFLHQRVDASGVRPGARARAVARPTASANAANSSCAASVLSSSRCSRDHAEVACTTQHCGRAGARSCWSCRRPRRSGLGPAAGLGAQVDRRVEREHAGPARRHAHVRPHGETRVRGLPARHRPAAQALPRPRRGT